MRIEQAIFVALVCVALKMQQHAVLIGFLYTCVSISCVLDYFNTDKGDLAVIRKLYRKLRQAGVEAIKSSEKINCSIGAGHCL